MSSSESSEHERSLQSRSNSESENGDSSELDIVVSGIKPYENEPLASSSDEDDDCQLDEDGLSPSVLCARFNGEITLDQWYVYFQLMLMTYFKHYGLIFNTYISLLVGVNVANVVPNTFKIRESVDAVTRFRKFCTSYYLTHRSKSLNV